MFGLTFPQVLKDYQNNIGDNLFCKYQYMLTVPSDVIGNDSLISFQDDPLLLTVTMCLIASN